MAEKLLYGSVIVAIFLFQSGCGGGSKSSKSSIEVNSADGPVLVVTSTLEKANEDCPDGGLQVDTGFDLNADNALDSDEITYTKTVCNNVTNFDSLIRIYDEPAGENCATGGKKLVIGRDINLDSELGPDEVDDAQYVCNGVTVGEGLADETGTSQLVNILDEASGENCSNGGKRIVTGIDADSDNLLAAEEINQTHFVCNGANGIDGLTTQSEQSISCSGPMENFDGYIWNYELHKLSSGDAVATASIVNQTTTVGAMEFYSAQELANDIKPAVQFVFDVVGIANYGFWSIFLDESLDKTFVYYSDPDKDPNPSVWSMTIDNCEITNFLQ